MALRQFLRQYGLRDTLERARAQAALKIGGAAIRKYSGSPTLLEFHQIARFVADSVPASLSAALDSRFIPDQLPMLMAEFDLLEAVLKERLKLRKLALPEYYGVDGKVARLLYALVRIVQPDTVLETGVANGHSSFFILNAMERNGAGTLHSVDIDPGAGVLIEESERRRWTLHLLDGTKSAYVNLIDSLPPCDLYIHDSNHSYWWMRFELESTLPALSRSAIIGCDDADHSYAFLDFCRAHQFQPVLLLDPRNVYGIIKCEVKQ